MIGIEVKEEKKPDMSMETNNWRINNPKWGDKNAPKWKCTNDSYWSGIYGSDYFLQMNKGHRVLFSYYCKEKHYYCLWVHGTHSVIFASYDLNEVIRFIKKLITTPRWRYDLYIKDMVTSQYYNFTHNDALDYAEFHFRKMQDHIFWKSCPR